MLTIKIKQGEEKLKIPMGIYVNGYIINVPMCIEQKSMVQLNNKVMVIQPNTATTPKKENEDGDT